MNGAILLVLLWVAVAPAQTPASRVPVPEWMQRADAAGTRDSSGRPGANYWQLHPEYTIRARLDPATAMVEGRETIRFRNTGPVPMTEVRLRLDQNLFRPDASTELPIPEFMQTDGIERLSVRLDGVAVRVVDATGTLGRIALSQSIPPGATAVLEISWRFRVPADPKGSAMRMGHRDHVLFQVAPGIEDPLLPGEHRWHFIADDVSDFAWAASNRFAWDVTHAALPERPPVLIHILYDHGGSHASAFATSGSSARDIVQRVSARWFPYPWPNLTIVDGPEKGMEYPMFVMSDPGLYGHEILHQWWPMSIGSDERRYAFMDEGFTSWAASWLTQDRTGKPPEPSEEGRVSPVPFILPDGENGKAMPYTPRMLAALSRIAGRDETGAALAAYSRAWRFKHPSPWDFMRFMNQALGRNLEAFWYEWLFAPATSNRTSRQRGARSEAAASAPR